MTGGEVLMCGAFALTLPVGQMLFKWASGHRSDPAGRLVRRLAGHWRLAIACGWYAATALFWFFVLTRVPLTAAFPFAIAGSGLVPLMAAVVFKEPLSWRYGAGYLLLLAGLALAVGEAA
jgi:drug/metabolite transporter (DMT)-like permease